MKKRVLLTGGNRGIGLAIKTKLEATNLYEVITPSSNVLDLSNIESIKKYCRDELKFDILINNAGVNFIRKIEEITSNDIETINNINLVAPLLLTQAVVKHMKINKWGKIINISSIWGVRSKEMRTLYSGTKFGIIGQTKALSRELGPENILVNAICPGYVMTDMTNSTVSKEEQEVIKESVPLKRFASPFEIAEMVEFLISERNTYMTGQTLVIDGGFTA
ncbi:MAG: SDR family oxidoreductase [Arcobacteraceae bacterium]|jgi:3-oxoacyl-[acyl-carrier protein] reductase|nr:SDR family oxidoreductase [Arcobacteraceae bacterium]